jgi:uncharacterized protein (TIGR02147 family)
VFNYASIPALLSDELRRRAHANPRYSLRSFARHLNLSPGALSEILRGQRDLSLKSVPNVAKAFGLNAVEGLHLLQLAQSAKAPPETSLGPAPVPRQALNENVFSLVSEWYHFAILNLFDCEALQWKAAWISARLGISRIQAQMAMDLLLRVGLVERQKGRYFAKNSEVVSPANVPSTAVRNYHRQILEKAILALETQNLQERDFGGCGFAIDITQLPALKKELSDFQDRLLAKYAKGKKTEVYFLEMALFKLTNRSNK